MTKGGNINVETDSDSAAMASNTSRNDDAAAVPHYVEPKNKNEIPSFLAILHLVTALFQCIQAIFLFAYSSNNDLRWMIFTNFPVAVDQNFREMEGLTDTGAIYYARPESKYIGGFGVPWMVGAFVLLSAVDHMICVVPGLRKYYEYYLARNQSPIRWAEYSLSMPLMKMHISQLAGVTDVHMLFLVFMLSHVIIYFVVLHEHLNARARADGFRQNWLPFFMGTVPFLACWSVVFCYYSETVARGDQPPEFVLPTMISLFCVELLFPVLFVLQWTKIGMFDDYMKGEFGFICLSFIAKSILAWTTLVGAETFVDNWRVNQLDTPNFN